MQIYLMRYFLRGSRCYLWLKNIDFMVCLKIILISDCIFDRFDTLKVSELLFSNIFSQRNLFPPKQDHSDAGL